MGKSRILFVFLVGSLMLISFISAASSFPAPRDVYVNDFAKIFNQEEASSLRALLYDTRQSTTAEVVIVTVETVGDYTPPDYATKLATEWKIGKSDVDNGLLILYTLKENKIWVATGYGIEGILPDSKVGRMLDDYYVPLRDKNKTKEGIINFTLEIVKVLNQNADEIRSGQGEKTNSEKGNGWIFILIILFFFVILPAILRRFAKKKPKGKPISVWDALFWAWVGSSVGRSSSSGGFGSGGGFSGGGGFGGGGFSGGGAGR